MIHLSLQALDIHKSEFSHLSRSPNVAETCQGSWVNWPCMSITNTTTTITIQSGMPSNSGIFSIQPCYLSQLTLPIGYKSRLCQHLHIELLNTKGRVVRIYQLKDCDEFKTSPCPLTAFSSFRLATTSGRTRVGMMQSPEKAPITGDRKGEMWKWSR